MDDAHPEVRRDRREQPWSDVSALRSEDLRDERRAAGLLRGPGEERLGQDDAHHAHAHRAGSNGVDLDDMLASADGAAKASRGTKPRFIAFASLSMPQASLKQMMRDVGGAGGIVVFRGFPNNSAKQFLAGAGKIVDKGVDLHGVGIDPRLFRAFGVAVVPTYVVASSDFQPCDGFHCQTALPPFDKLTGNVTAGYALATIAEGNGPGAAVARVYLAALHKMGAQ